MDKKTLFMTLGAAVVIGGIGSFMYDSQQGTQELQSGLILPELASSAATLERIKIEGAGNKLLVESHKDGDNWVVDNLGNYLADTGPLSRLINNLKDARKVEAKTAKTELFHHLGLRDISNEESKAVLVTVSGGGKSYQLLIGDTAKNGTGQYVRIAGDNQTWLVDKSFNKPEKAEDWVNTKLFDFELNDIQSVELSGTYQYRLSKDDKEQRYFTLASIPQGHELKYDSIVDSMPRALGNLRFESLKAASEYQAGESVDKLSVQLFEKQVGVELSLSKSDDKFYAQVSGDNPQWQQWVYEISEYNFKQLVKNPADYLNEVKKAETTAEAQVESAP